MKKHVILILSSILLISSCGENSDGKITSSKDEEVVYDWTISFVSNGGSEIAPLKLKDGEVATKPANPTREGYIFEDWFVDTYLTVSFNWETQITSDWTLYASWKEDETHQSSSEDTNSSSEDESSSEEIVSSSSEEEDQIGHGPDGSTLTSWYLVGSGSLWDSSNGWTVAGGVQLYTNPANLQDKGCILGVNLEVGDTFKVTDGGSTWFGYEKVDTASSSNNRGVTNFIGSNDGYGGQNFQCTVAGYYDMYINGSGVFWIQDSI